MRRPSRQARGRAGRAVSGDHSRASARSTRRGPRTAAPTGAASPPRGACSKDDGDGDRRRVRRAKPTNQPCAAPTGSRRYRSSPRREPATRAPTANAPGVPDCVDERPREIRATSAVITPGPARRPARKAFRRHRAHRDRMVRVHLDAAVRDRGGHQRHLERRHEQLALAEPVSATRVGRSRVPSGRAGRARPGGRAAERARSGDRGLGEARHRWRARLWRSRCSPSAPSRARIEVAVGGLGSGPRTRHEGSAWKGSSTRTFAAGSTRRRSSRRGRGHDLEDRARRVEALRRAVEEGRPSAPVAMAPGGHGAAGSASAPVSGAGRLTDARIWPVRGSSATTAPVRPASAAVAASLRRGIDAGSPTPAVPASPGSGREDGEAGRRTPARRAPRRRPADPSRAVRRQA